MSLYKNIRNVDIIFPSLPVEWGKYIQGACMLAKSLQSCPTLCDPMDCSPTGFSDHGTLQARTLEWIAMPSSRGSSRPRDRAPVSRQADSLPLAPPEKSIAKVHFSILLATKSFPRNILLLLTKSQCFIENKDN